MDAGLHSLVPGRLWSLLEIMQRFHAPAAMAVIRTLSGVSMMTRIMDWSGAGQGREADRAAFRNALAECQNTLDEMPLSRVLRSQFDHLKEAVEYSTGAQMSALTMSFANSLLVELTEAWFLVIPADKREFYQQTNLPFGDAVSGTFPEAGQDIAAASRCLALDEWTAMVFHLMRVLEHGLRALASMVGLQPNEIDRENWKNVIDLIEKKIRLVENEKKSAEKSERLQTLSAAAVQFRYFKDAWRNHVSHSHVSYDQRAVSIWHAVREFMVQVSVIAMLS